MAEYSDYKYPKLVEKPKIPIEARATIEVLKVSTAECVYSCSLFPRSGPRL